VTEREDGRITRITKNNNNEEKKAEKQTGRGKLRIEDGTNGQELLYEVDWDIGIGTDWHRGRRGWANFFFPFFFWFLLVFSSFFPCLLISFYGFPRR
jgi:hypothetical protein